MENSLMIFVLGAFYISAAISMFSNRYMTKPGMILVSAPLLWTGFLNILYLLMPFPHVFLWLSQMSLLMGIILVNMFYRGKK